MTKGGYRKAGIFFWRLDLSRSDIGATEPSQGKDGFTIVETLIVLAVTSALFVSIAATIVGRQGRAQFMTGINDVKQHLQQIINETESGYYPNNGNFQCLAGTPPQINGVSGNSLGTNGDCIFLGNVIYFGKGQPDTVFSIYPIAGNRQKSGANVTSLDDAWPTAIAPGTSTNSGTPDDSTTYTMPNGLTFAWARAPGFNTAAALGFLTTVDGSQKFSLYKFGNPWGTPGSTGDIVDDINNATTGAGTTITPQGGPLNVCIASGTTNQSGLITFSQDLAVTLQIKDGSTVC